MRTCALRRTKCALLSRSAYDARSRKASEKVAATRLRAVELHCESRHQGATRDCVLRPALPVTRLARASS